MKNNFEVLEIDGEIILEKKYNEGKIASVRHHYNNDFSIQKQVEKIVLNEINLKH